LHRAWAADLEKKDDGYWPRFHADVMGEIMDSMIQPRWEEWQSATAPTLVVYGEEGMFSADGRSRFIRFGRDVRRVGIPAGSHDAHLDAFDSWIAALRAFLA
jgi:pimeloyl-ACP methyl ester carboxylesterase